MSPLAIVLDMALAEVLIALSAAHVNLTNASANFHSHQLHQVTSPSPFPFYLSTQQITLQQLGRQHFSTSAPNPCVPLSAPCGIRGIRDRDSLPRPLPRSGITAQPQREL